MVIDAWFDWFGYKEIPSVMRYSIVLFLIAAPIWTFFFFCCCLHNDEHDDPEEERKFLERFERWEKRK